MVAWNKDLIFGVGLYTPVEAAMLARITPGLMKRWIHGTGRSQPTVKARFADDPERIITFLDLIQALAIRELRFQEQMSLQKIREAAATARENGIEYPFATKGFKYYIFEHKLWLEDEHGHMIGLNRPDKHQRLMRPVVMPFLRRVKFDETTKLATQFIADQREGIRIVIDPNRRFGQPIVEPTGYTVFTLVDAYRSEGGGDEGMKQIVKGYGVTEQAINAALDYYETLGIAA